MGPKLTRRALIGAIPFGLFAQTANRRTPTVSNKKNRQLPTAGEFTRIIDSVTENQLTRLTSPAFTSRLTALGNQFVSVRERTLLFSSNRTGKLVPFQVDLRNGALKQIAEPQRLDPRSLCFDKAQKSVFFLDGDQLLQANLAKFAVQTLAEDVSWFRFGSGGELYAIQGGKMTLREGSKWRTLAEPALACWPQPGGSGCLLARNEDGNSTEFWYKPMQAEGPPVLLASGRVRDPFWDVDGQSILFLRDVTNAKGTVLTEIHRKVVGVEEEKSISSTSQFASFTPNGDSTVFVGASRSRAQPSVVLLLRYPSREMTLCEHGSKHSDDVLPAFSPDSRRVYFESDREGNPAIYSINVEALVEPIAIADYARVTP